MNYTIKIIKKDGTLEDYTEQKIINACSLAANRALLKLTNNDYIQISACSIINGIFNSTHCNCVPVSITRHNACY